jgi:uncharacterized protein (TIGR00251 family)
LADTWFRFDPDKDVLSLFLHVQPGARGSASGGMHGGRLKLRVGSPAIAGRANDAVVEWVGEMFNLPASRVIIRRGRHSRIKTVDILSPGPHWFSHLEKLASS